VKKFKKGLNVKQWRFEISSKKGFPDIHGGDVLEDIRQLNISSVEDVVSEKVFLPIRSVRIGILARAAFLPDRCRHRWSRSILKVA
jgi:hypothetical protein